MRNRQIHIFLLLAFSLIINSKGVAQGTKAFDFEDNIPVQFKTQGVVLQISHARYGTGKSSLKWTCQPGDKLKYKGEIGFHKATVDTIIHLHGRDYPQYETPIALYFWMYNSEKSDTKLKISFGRNGNTDCYATVLLNFVGWRPVNLIYERGHFIGSPHSDMDECTIEALNGEGAEVYFDNFKFATQELHPLHYFYPQSHLPTLKLHPERQSYGAWYVDDSHLNEPWLPLTTPTKKELDDINTIEKRLLALEFDIEPNSPKKKLSNKTMAAIQREFEEMGVVENNGTINGPVYIYDRKTRTRNNKLMQKMGQLYQSCSNEKQKQELANKIILLYRHGKQVNISIDWYDGRGFVAGLYLIREELKKQGMLDEVVAFIKSRYSFNRIYDETRTMGYMSKGESSDAIYTNLKSELMTIFMMEDGPEKVRNLKHFSSYLSNVAFNYSPGMRDCLKPDGSHFHHVTAHHTRYGNYTPSIMGLMTRYMARTSFRVSTEAHERLKHHARVRYFTTTPKFFPYCMKHIHFPGNFKTLVDVYKQLAYAGTPDGKDSIDTEMAAMYARTEYNKKLNKDSRNLLKDYPSKAPLASGHHTLTYNAKAFHRKDNWMVALGAHSAYFFPFERWENDSDAKYAQFINWGNLEVILPDTAGAKDANNAFFSEGWDYTLFPGATTVDVPIEKYKINILNVGDDHDEHLRSDIKFVGGLDFSDGNGVFASPIHGHYKYGLESFYATKTYFFFNDLIICLGSDIKNEISEYNTQTCLFQNYLERTDDLVFVNKQQGQSNFPFALSPESSQNHWLIDNRKVGYYIPKGQKINIKKSKQVADYGEHKSANFATAWLEHGKAPKNAGYEYAMKVQTTPKEMEAFTKSMSSDVKPYTVLQKDDKAHIVKHTPTNTTAIVLFQKNYSLNIGKIKGVTQPSLLMVSENNNSLNLAISDPDMRFYEGYPDDINRDFSRREIPSYSHSWYGNESRPSNIRVMLHGNWELENVVNGNAKIIQHANNITIVEFICREGFTNEAELKQL